MNLLDLTRNDVVRYACTCGQLKPISLLYFCRHCLKLRCSYCVCHEVDSHYCSNCLEILPSAEARLKKNRCQTCFDCPSCLNTLAVRSTTVTVRDPDDPSKVNSQKKLYYHACFFCRWTTRDAGLPDQPVQTVTSSGWPQRETSNTHRINLLLEHARMLGLLERHEREQREKKSTPRLRRTYSHLSGLTAAQVRKRAGLPPELPAASTIKDSLAEFSPAVAKEEVQQLPSDIFTKELDLNEVSTLTQRLAQPEIQPISTLDLVPSHTHLSIKRSQRCRECEHNVSKPELNPASIKFKIQQAAYFHVPDVRLVTCELLRPNKASEMVVIVSNPSQHPTTLNFIPLEDALEEIKQQQQQQEEMKTEVVPNQSESPASLPSLIRSVSIMEEPRPIKIDLNANVCLPPSDIPILLPKKDDAAEYDDSGDTQQFQDDPKVFVCRKANKASLRMTVTPHKTSAGQDCQVGFAIRYSYMNRIAAPVTAPLDQKPQKVQLCTCVLINCGKVYTEE